MMDKMEKAKAGMPQKTSIEIGRMIMEEEWQGKNRAALSALQA